ncbi:hypothetical protein C8E83_2595 [Frondihabitans australicus]|uniref:Uncharacterized protein n=1 Tax=Frondihabitans australicus TaxID=386892 RepID=A0A495IHI8_9MICO|nr:hypothetical protein C8E83_2595 [Frondihabitans australicus]
MTNTAHNTVLTVTVAGGVYVAASRRRQETFAA